MIQEARARPRVDRLPSVTVIIPHYNDLTGLQVCYAQLTKQTWPSTDFEILVVDNNSSCAIEAVQATVPTAKVISEPIQGAGPARNAGVSASSGRILAFLDSDCIPYQSWIEEGVAALEKNDFVGGQVVTLPRDMNCPNEIEAFECVFGFNFRRYIERVGYTGTGNMFVTRQVFDRVGGFRTGVPEDMDWSFRARRLGYTLGYAERAVVGHPARRTWVSLRSRWARMEAEHFLLARDRRLGKTVYLIKAACMPLSIIPHTCKVLKAPQLRTTRARVGAIAVLTRLRLWRSKEMVWLAINAGAVRGGALKCD